MKVYFLFLLSFILLSLESKGVEKLRLVGRRNGLREGETAIYGSFVQRLGFSSGGYKQKIIIMDTLTKETYSLMVKPSIGIAKEYLFFARIKPGVYAILNYEFTRSTWYGSEINRNTAIKPKPKSKALSTENVKGAINDLYLFKVESKCINYVGVWDFSSNNLWFRNEKDDVDISMNKYYPHINFKESKLNMPF